MSKVRLRNQSQAETVTSNDAGNGGAKESARERAQRQKRAMEELRSKLGKA